MKTFYPYLILALLLLPGPALSAPQAVPVEPVYQFAPVPEGEHLTHEFVLKNQGDIPLNIVDVIPP